VRTKDSDGVAFSVVTVLLVEHWEGYLPVKVSLWGDLVRDPAKPMEKYADETKSMNVFMEAVPILASNAVIFVHTG